MTLRRWAVKSTDMVRGVRTGDGTEATVALLNMQRGDQLVSLRIAAADGRSLKIRLGQVNAYNLLMALAEGIERLPGGLEEAEALSARVAEEHERRGSVQRQVR